jgi:hypothetical protein
MCVWMWLCFWFVVSVLLWLLFGVVLGHCLYAGWIVVGSLCSRIETSLLQQLSRYQLGSTSYNACIIATT